MEASDRPIAAGETDYLTEMTRPFAQSGKVVFTNYPGGFGNDIEHSYHDIIYLLKTDYLPLYFDFEFGQINTPNYFKETYRVAYLTSPHLVRKDGRGSLPMPPPPFFGNFIGPAYGMGICFNKTRSPKAPGVTPWLNLQEIKLYTQ